MVTYNLHLLCMRPNLFTPSKNIWSEVVSVKLSRIDVDLCNVDFPFHHRGVPDPTRQEREVQNIKSSHVPTIFTVAYIWGKGKRQQRELWHFGVMSVSTHEFIFILWNISYDYDSQCFTGWWGVLTLESSTLAGQYQLLVELLTFNKPLARGMGNPDIRSRILRCLWLL